MREKVREILKRHGKEILKYPNVVGYSNVPQPRIRKGKVIPEEKVIRIYVVKKVPKDQLKPSEIIPPEVEGVKTDVVEIGKIRKLDVYTDRYRPAPCGVSTSRADQIAAGTIGWWMVDEDGNVYLLSNNHVWANENDASVGDKIVQPGRLDGGDPEKDVVGELYSWIDIDFSGNVANTVDAAIARPLDLSQLYMSIMEIGGVAGKADPVQGTIAKKVGRTTGLTQGTITDESATVYVEYDKGTALFEDVFVVEGEVGLVKGGDSGSPVLDENNNFLGLLFAGAEDRVLVACKASNIESSFQSKLGKKIWILQANAYPPFRYEERPVYIYQKVYPTSLEVMALSLQMIAQFTAFTLVMIPIAHFMKESLRFASE